MGSQGIDQLLLFHAKHVDLTARAQASDESILRPSPTRYALSHNQSAQTFGRIQTIQRSTSSPGTVNGST